MNKLELINKFKDGESRYVKSATLHIVIDSLYYNGYNEENIILLLDQLCIALDESTNKIHELVIQSKVPFPTLDQLS